MLKLVIDDHEIEVPAGTKVIEAAEQLGIMIPRFCYHKALGSVGACRMCAVKFLQGPFKGVQMSCMIDAQDGMVVSTTDEEAVTFRKYIIELLMLNHPHDCPVCDEGGQCLLQDMTVSGGHGVRRFLGHKRTYRDQDLGVFITHEMNRCIHCYRCSRFYQDFSGYRDLGPMQIANRVYFGRFEDGQLKSPFSGNLVDLCPTGVYTDKPARYKGRRWDFQRSPSLCLHCSLGCNTFANARYRELVRVEARFSESVNGYFICDQGRFGFSYANHPERPRRAKIGGIEGPLNEAVRNAAERLTDIQDRFGRNAIACLGSLRCSLETQSMLKQLCRSLSWQAPAYFFDPSLKKKVRSAVSQLDARVAVSLRQIEDADFILTIGVDPINEAPMLALAMRQAHRKEAAVALIDPRPIVLPFPFEHLPVPLGNIDRCLKWFAYEARSGGEEHSHPVANGDEGDSPENHPSSHFGVTVRQQVARLAAQLKASRNPVLICGMQILPETTPSVVGDFSRSLFQEKGKCGLSYILPGANAFGAALLDSADDHSFLGTVEAIERDEVKALMVVEADPFAQFPDRSRLELALDKLELLLVMDHVPSQVAHRAHVFLPTSTVFETGSSFINQEGRIQFAAPVYQGGAPLSQVSGGSHPPRVYGDVIPGGEPKPAWQLLVELAGVLAAGEEIAPGNDPLVLTLNEHPFFAPLQTAKRPIDGIRCLPEVADPAVPAGAAGARGQGAADQLQLLLVDSLFGTEELVQYSDVIQKLEDEPRVCMHADDAVRFGLVDGDRVVMHLEGGPLEVGVNLSDDMVPGILVLPRHRKLAWQKVKDFTIPVPFDSIEKI
jgi:NADH-quinone oxidoreductase subunit G